MTFFRDLWKKFLDGNTLTRLLYINVAMFVLIIFFKTLAILMLVRHADMTEQLFQFHWESGMILRRPWTIVTAMFTSHGIWHLLFNMLTLYWFGTLFLQYFNNSTLRGIYVLGALSSMLFYFLYFQLFSPDDYAPGFPAASGAILSIASVLAFKAPEHAEALPLIGPMKTKYLALTLVLIDIALFPEGNPATDTAHLGAFLLGFLYYHMLKKGTDITKPVTYTIIAIQNIAAAFIEKIRRKQ